MTPIITKHLRHENKNYEIVARFYPEQMDPKGQFSDPRDARKILNRLEKEDHSAWFMVEVEVSLKDTSIKASDHLGGCSYKSFDDFIDSDDYYQDMVSQATSELELKMKDHKIVLEKALG